jgi:hypothetical protein
MIKAGVVLWQVLYSGNASSCNPEHATSMPAVLAMCHNALSSRQKFKTEVLCCRLLQAPPSPCFS